MKTNEISYTIILMNECHTANRYLLSPIRSRYRRQNGSVPKFFVIELSSDFADVNL